VPPPILVVDDEQQFRSVVADILEESGYPVTVAGNGTEALTVAAAEPPRLALLDYTMPGMNGLELGTHLRRQWPQLPLIFMSADTLPAQAFDAFDSCMFLQKPFDMDTLLDATRSFIPD